LKATAARYARPTAITATPALIEPPLKRFRLESVMASTSTNPETTATA
jgi:hypothetical protein